MSSEDRIEPIQPEDASTEGAFDVQLSFPGAFIEAPQPVKTVIKRDGRQAPFDKHAIADAIFEAAKSIGGADRDRAESLASGVAIYLMKTGRNTPPTVDQIHDAVEKVLIEMGHAKTALAYARARDKRDRVRRLREGDTQAILNELREARVDEQRRDAGGRRLTVRTSADRIAAWDRGRIAEALVVETGMDPTVADLVALEVEQQIFSAEVKTLTAPLIRELVDAKLIEHGLEEFRRKHARLGVPLYDAERLICAPNRESAFSRHDPESTNRMVAEQVKKEYALTEVFSEPVARAHLEGDVHIHGLGFVDRLHSGTHSLGYVARVGCGRFTGGRPMPPPGEPNELVGQAASFCAALRRHFTRTTAWRFLNVYMAPFIEGIDDDALHELAQRTLLALAQPIAGPGDDRATTEIGICWNPPDALGRTQAVGPRGALTGRVYDDYRHAAQRFAWALLDAYGEQPMGARPQPVLRIGRGFFAAPGAREFLQHAVETVGLSGNLDIEIEGRQKTQHTISHTWAPSFIAVHEVTVNVTRAAYGAKNEADMANRLAAMVATAVQAHIEKQRFAERLISLKEIGPLALLTTRCDGRPYLDLSRAAYLVGVAGLNEGVRALTGRQLHETPEALECGLRIVRGMAGLCKEHATRQDLCVELSQTTSPEATQRLAAIDLARFPDEARAVVTSDPITHEIRYTPGVQLSPADRMTPIERVRREGAFHPWFQPAVPIAVAMPDSETSKQAVASFIEKATRHTAARRIELRTP